MIRRTYVGRGFEMKAGRFRAMVCWVDRAEWECSLWLADDEGFSRTLFNLGPGVIPF